jgi:hypothetical protein
VGSGFHGGRRVFVAGSGAAEKTASP